MSSSSSITSGDSEWYHFISTPSFLTRREVELCLDTDLEHIQPSREPCTNPARYRRLAAAKSVFKRLLQRFYQASNFKMWKNGKTRESHACGLIATLLCYEVSSSIGRNAVWNTMTVNRYSESPWKIICVMCREGKFIFTVNVYSSKNKMSPLPRWKWSCMITLLPCSWLITPRNSVLLRTQCWSLLLEDWALSVIARSALVNRSPCWWAQA